MKCKQNDCGMTEIRSTVRFGTSSSLGGVSPFFLCYLLFQELWLCYGVACIMKATILLLKAVRVGFFVFVLVGCATVKSQDPPAAWRTVNGGMTRQEISQLIGPPAQVSDRGGDIWLKAGWELQVDYDQYGRARNILSHPVGR